MVEFLPPKMAMMAEPEGGYRDNAKPPEKTLEELEKEAEDAIYLLDMEVRVFDLAEKMFLAQNWTGVKSDERIVFARSFLKKRDEAVRPLQRAAKIAREAYLAEEAEERRRQRERNKAPRTGSW